VNGGAYIGHIETKCKQLYQYLEHNLPLTASKIVTESVKSDEERRAQNSKVEGMNEKGEIIKFYASPFVFGPPPLAANPADCKPRWTNRPPR
jgi:hypothetical protein